MKQCVTMVEEFLALIITLISERYTPGVGKVSQSLCCKPDLLFMGWSMREEPTLSQVSMGLSFGLNVPSVWLITGLEELGKTKGQIENIHKPCSLGQC